MGFRSPLTSASPALARPVASAPTPITAPPAPQQLTAQHNLFTLAEVSAALALLRSGDAARGPEEVSVTWRSGASRLLLIEDMSRIADLEDIESIDVAWQYADGSKVSGALVDQPQAGSLSVVDGGQALAATHSCIDHLAGLRTQRSAVRGFLAGRGPLRVVTVLAAITGAVLTFRSRSGPDLLTTPAVAAAAGLSLMIGGLLTAGSLWLWRRTVLHFGGTRVGRGPQVHHTRLTAELAVLAAALGVPIAVLGVLVTILTS